MGDNDLRPLLAMAGAILTSVTAACWILVLNSENPKAIEVIFFTAMLVLFVVADYLILYLYDTKQTRRGLEKSKSYQVTSFDVISKDREKLRVHYLDGGATKSITIARRSTLCRLDYILSEDPAVLEASYKIRYRPTGHIEISCDLYNAFEVALGYESIT